MLRRTLIHGLAVLPFAAPAVAEPQPRLLSLGNASVGLLIEPKAEPAFEDLLIAWIEKSARAVMIYYGRFPVDRVAIVLTPFDGSGVRGGRTFPGEIPTIRIRVGRDTHPDRLLQSDWVMVHEMIHLAFPWLERKHNWMAEGLAVYVESVARVQAGQIPSRRIWADFMRDMPKGLPRAGAGGLDEDRSWGRTYWGGALFCLLADIDYREKTHNRRGLQTALRAINAERDFRQGWPLEETLAIGDAAVGAPVLIPLYENMRARAVTTDLATLWHSLGVNERDGSVSFNESAPLAAIRSGITQA